MTDQNQKASLDSNPVLAKVIVRIASTNAPDKAAANLAATVKRDLKTRESVDLARPMEQDSMKTSEKRIRQHTSNWMSPILRVLSAAAAIAVIGFATLSNFPGKSSAFADMQNAIAQSKSIQCSSAKFRAGENLPLETETIWIQEPKWVRSECNDETGSTVIVIDLEAGDFASWWSASSHGTIGVLPDAKLQKDVLCQFIDILRNANLDDVKQVDRYRSDDQEWLAEYEYLATLVDGPTVLVNVVVNEVTSLPVEISFYDDKDNLVQNFADLSFDQPHDPNLFLIELPEGYKAIDMNGGAD